MELDGTQGVMGLLGILATILLNQVRNQRKSQEQAAQPADTKLIDLASDINENNKGLTGAINNLNETLQTQNTRLLQIETRMSEERDMSRKEHVLITQSNHSIVDASKMVVDTVDLLNRTIAPKLDSILKDVSGLPEKINPSIETLTQQLIQTENRVDKNMDGQTETNDQILAALLRIEKELKDLKSEFAERIEKTEQDVAAIKADVIKNATPPPAPANQPIVKPDAAPPIAAKIEPKTETKKDKPNAV